MMSERWIGNVLEENGHVLFCITMKAFVWRLREKSRKTGVRVLGVRSEKRAGHLKDKSKNITV
jgi:hypothetical protein